MRMIVNLKYFLILFQIVISDYNAFLGLGYEDKKANKKHFCCSEELFNEGKCQTIDSLILDETNNYIQRKSISIDTYNNIILENKLKIYIFQ